MHSRMCKNLEKPCMIYSRPSRTASTFYLFKRPLTISFEKSRALPLSWVTTSSAPSFIAIGNVSTSGQHTQNLKSPFTSTRASPPNTSFSLTWTLLSTATFLSYACDITCHAPTFSTLSTSTTNQARVTQPLNPFCALLHLSQTWPSSRVTLTYTLPFGIRRYLLTQGSVNAFSTLFLTYNSTWRMTTATPHGRIATAPPQLLTFYSIMTYSLESPHRRLSISTVGGARTMPSCFSRLTSKSRIGAVLT